MEDFKTKYIGIDENGMIFVDKNMVNLDIINYKITHEIYRTQVSFDNNLSEHFDIVERVHADSRYIDLMAAEKMSFKECCEQYNDLKPQPGTFHFFEDERLVRLRNLCPEACQAVDKFGIEEIRKMKYHKQNIHRKLVSADGRPQDLKIKRELDHRFNKFEAYSIPTIKKVLGDIYADVGLDKRPVATDLNR